MTVGEAPMMKPNVALSYIAEDGAKDLDLMFHFQHMEADCLFIDYIPRPFSLRKLKRAFSRWQKEINGKGWNTLYLENHDHPRVISRYGSEKYRTESGKMLAASFLFQQGTPFIYQGQEIGMTNISLDTIDDYKDVMTKNEYAKKKRWPEKKRMTLIRRATRESSRTPMQWSAEKNAGFTSAEPWFTVNPNYTEINVEKENADENSLLNFYRKSLKLRKETPVILWGSYKEHYPRSNVFYTYEREYQGARLLVICSFSEDEKRFKAPAGFDLNKGELVLSNYDPAPAENNSFTARPYETRVYLFDKCE
jgi:oligo-1,6-glucosidase